VFMLDLEVLRERHSNQLTVASGVFLPHFRKRARTVDLPILVENAIAPVVFLLIAMLAVMLAVLWF